MTDIQYGIKIMGGREVSRPYRFFSPKASGFYPFGDATALPSEGGGIAKRLFFMFLFLCPQYFSTEPKLDFNGLNRCSRFI
ncbi:MAG: hypothetical protein SPJ46_01725 [Sodaliphilus sp.]|nr:hypothetical protein [Sodaliphilus sp.]